MGRRARDGAAAGTTRAPAKRARAAPVSVAARVLALVDAHERLPPSPFERWRERLRDDAENRAPRSGEGHAPGRAAGPSGAGGGDTRGIADVLGTDWTRKNAPPVAPLPSLTWDQHAVFLQFPPTRRVTADDLPRGLAPATLTELYRRVEREQKRFFAHAARGAPLPGATDGENDKAESRKARYREIAGDANHVVAEKRWRARLAEAAFFVRPKSAGALQSGGVAPRRATAMPVVVALERELSAALNPKHSETPETLLEIGADLDLDPDLDPDPSRDKNDLDRSTPRLAAPRRRARAAFWRRGSPRRNFYFFGSRRGVFFVAVLFRLLSRRRERKEHSADDKRAPSRRGDDRGGVSMLRVPRAGPTPPRVGGAVPRGRLRRFPERLEKDDRAFLRPFAIA